MRVETERMYLYSLSDEEVIEIGYGLKEEYRHYGYMTEAVKAITEWALSQENVKQVEVRNRCGKYSLTESPLPVRICQ